MYSFNVKREHKGEPSGTQTTKKARTEATQNDTKRQSLSFSLLPNAQGLLILRILKSSISKRGGRTNRRGRIVQLSRRHRRAARSCFKYTTHKFRHTSLLLIGRHMLVIQHRPGILDIFKLRLIKEKSRAWCPYSQLLWLYFFPLELD